MKKSDSSTPQAGKIPTDAMCAPLSSEVTEPYKISELSGSLLEFIMHEKN